MKPQLTRYQMEQSALALGARLKTVRQWRQRGWPANWLLKLQEDFGEPLDIVEIWTEQDHKRWLEGLDRARVRKHPEIRVEELLCLPFAIALGEYREDAHRERCVTIFYNEPIKNTLYIIGVKSASSDGETWVQSFYRTTPDKSKNKHQHNKILCKGR
jgi:hypothetical protein